MVRIACNRVQTTPTGRSFGLFGLPPACRVVNPGPPRIATPGLPLRLWGLERSHSNLMATLE